MQIQVPQFVKYILASFEKAGHEVYVVGGAVRDLLINRNVYDWDFTTNATPEQILNMFSDGFYDNAFGTVGLVDPKDKKLHEAGKLDQVPVYDLTTFRKEVGYSDRRHPDHIEWGKTLEEDLQRRDFTINAMALKTVISNQLSVVSKKKERSRHKIETKNYQLTTKNFELIDYFGGQKDLDNGLIRAVGKPQERFEEDALRMMRAVRIAAQLGFVVETTTLDAIQQSARLIDLIAKERISLELLKILMTDYPADGIRMLAGTGLMEFIIPELLSSQGVDQAGHHVDDVWEHSIKSLQKCPSKDPIIRLATLIHDIGKPFSRAFNCQKCKTRFKQTGSELKCPECGFVNDYFQSVTFYNHEIVSAKLANKIANRLRFSNQQREKLITLVRCHMFSVDERQTDKAIRRFIRNVGKEYLDDILAVRTGDRLGGGARETSWRLERFKKKLIEVQKQPFTVHDLKITGHEVMVILNLESGPKVGRILQQLYDEVVEKHLDNDQDILLKRLKDLDNNQ